MLKITVVGAGSWGTTLAMILGEKGYRVNLWSRREQLADKINQLNENKEYLPGIKIPKNVVAVFNLEECQNSDIIVFAVPSFALRKTARKFSSIIKKDVNIVHVIKGMEEDTRKFMSKVLEEELAGEIAVLSGPNHAEEVAIKLPTATVIASKNYKLSKELCKVFLTKNFKPYPHHDVAGVEICGAVKNTVAIATGVCEGLELGDNAKASIITLGLTEMSRVAQTFGAKRATCFGLAGVGDLVVTCYSKHSRNRTVGEKLAKGKSMEKIKEEMRGMIAEGIRSTKSIYELCRENMVDTILINQVYEVLYKNMDLRKAIEQLLYQV